MDILEPKLWFKMSEGLLKGRNIEYYKKHLRDVVNLYKSNNISAYDPETVMYEVYLYGEGDSKKQGNLFYGLTIMHPVYIEYECNMTRGHFHQDKNCAEYYFCIEGEGLLLFMNDNSEMWIEKVFPGSVHYIDGKYAHRLVNIGDSILKVGACWPTTAGHDYDAIEKNEFPYRVCKRNSKVEFVKR